MLELPVFELRDVRLQAVADHRTRMRIVAAVQHQNGAVDRGESRRVNARVLEAEHVMPGLGLALWIEMLDRILRAGGATVGIKGVGEPVRLRQPLSFVRKSRFELRELRLQLRTGALRQS